MLSKRRVKFMMTRKGSCESLLDTLFYTISFLAGAGWGGGRGDWISLVDFLLVFRRETTFMTSYMLFCTLNPICKRVYSKRKEFAPRGSKFFPFRVDPFSDSDFDKKLDKK